MKTKEQKRVEAEVRQEEYDALTTSEKIERAWSRPGNSSREGRRLMRQQAEAEQA